MNLTPPRLRRVAIGLAAAACLAGVTACGAGLDAQTQQVYQPAVGANEHTKRLDLLNVVAVENADGTATVSATLKNKAAEDDTLTTLSATTSDGRNTDVELADPIDLPAGTPVQIGEEPQIVVGDGIAPGDYVTLNAEFETSGPVEIDVPVVDRGKEGIYDEVAEPESTQNKNQKSKNSSNNSDDSADSESSEH